MTWNRAGDTLFVGPSPGSIFIPLRFTVIKTIIVLLGNRADSLMIALERKHRTNGSSTHERT